MIVGPSRLFAIGHQWQPYHPHTCSGRARERIKNSEMCAPKNHKKIIKKSFFSRPTVIGKRGNLIKTKKNEQQNE
jgi:hypothetical protein